MAKGFSDTTPYNFIQSYSAMEEKYGYQGFGFV